MSSTHYESLGYDGVSRLTGLGLDLAGTSDDLTLGFAYNPASQIASTTRSNDGYAWTGAATGAKSYTSNELNQYGTAGGSSLSYDTKGNTTAIGSNAYTYSSENLLLTGPNSASLIYDPLMRLYQTSASGFTTTRFAYDGQNLIGEYDTSGSLLKRYVHGPGADEPLVEYDGSGTRTYLAADERGSIVSRSNASGSSTGKNSYDEYGNPSSGNAGRFSYTGQTWLFEYGLSYYKARMYAPALGRFLQTDPIGYGDGLNWYNYVSDDPVNLIDSNGFNGDEGSKPRSSDYCEEYPQDERCPQIVITGYRFGGGSGSGGNGGFGGGAAGGQRGVSDNGEDAGYDPTQDIIITATRPKPNPKPASPPPGKLQCLKAVAGGAISAAVDPASLTASGTGGAIANAGRIGRAVYPASRLTTIARAAAPGFLIGEALLAIIGGVKAYFNDARCR